MEHLSHFILHEHPDLVKKIVLGEPYILSLLEDTPYYYSKNSDTIREMSLNIH
jgi:hypothetical protein